MKKKFTNFKRILCLSLIFVSTSVWAREWKSVTNTTVTGDLVRVFQKDEATQVAIRAADGYLHVISTNDLCESDRQFIADFESNKIKSGGEKVDVFARPGNKNLKPVGQIGQKSSGIPEKFAILIGVNQYPNFSPKNQLQFCESDMEMLGKDVG